MKYHYQDHPQTCDPKDYWGQVKRTEGGKPVDAEQIEMIVSAISDGLALDEQDFLLDLCCGNGALSDLIFARCQGGVGVDFSDYLIQIARQDFQRLPERRYELGSVNDYLRSEAHPERFTKALCYGGFMFFDAAMSRDFLLELRRRFPRVDRLFLGNLPDKARMGTFFREGEYQPGIEDDPCSPIGIWRTEQEFSALAAECGWHARFSRMPETFYAAKYRYDAVLTPLAAPKSAA